MSIMRSRLAVETRARGFVEITRVVRDAVRASGIAEGLCNVFLEHTSASLVFCENADPDVRTDLEAFMAQLAPDGDPRWVHRAEGPDDMPAHVRSVLTLATATIPVSAGGLVLGTWQGLYLWEHRRAAHRRWLTITVWD